MTAFNAARQAAGDDDDRRTWCGAPSGGLPAGERGLALWGRRSLRRRVTPDPEKEQARRRDPLRYGLTMHDAPSSSCHLPDAAARCGSGSEALAGSGTAEFDC
jgi:hypothetical protein